MSDAIVGHWKAWVILLVGLSLLVYVSDIARNRYAAQIPDSPTAEGAISSEEKNEVLMQLSGNSESRLPEPAVRDDVLNSTRDAHEPGTPELTRIDVLREL